MWSSSCSLVDPPIWLCSPSGELVLGQVVHLGKQISSALLRPDGICRSIVITKALVFEKFTLRVDDIITVLQVKNEYPAKGLITDRHLQDVHPDDLTGVYTLVVMCLDPAHFFTFRFFR